MLIFSRIFRTIITVIILGIIFLSIMVQGLLSVLLPVLDEEENLPILFELLEEHLG